MNKKSDFYFWKRFCIGWLIVGQITELITVSIQAGSSWWIVCLKTILFRTIGWYIVYIAFIKKE